MGNLCQSGSRAGSGRAGKLHQNYELLGSIGEGSTALVFAAVRKHDGRRVAVKEIDKAKFSPDEVAGLLSRSVRVLACEWSPQACRSSRA